MVIDPENEEKNTNRLMGTAVFKEGLYPDYVQGDFPDKDIIHFVFLIEKNNEKISQIMKHIVMKLICYDMNGLENLLEGVKFEVKITG